MDDEFDDFLVMDGDEGELHARLIVKKGNSTWEKPDGSSLPTKKILQASKREYFLPFFGLHYGNYIEQFLPGPLSENLTPVYFVDRDGDRVLLDSVDSYVEAIKDAKITGQLVVEIGERKTETPDWFFTEMQKMKKELKKEIMVEIGRSSVNNAVAPVKDENAAAVMDQPAPNQSMVVKKPKPMKGDYIARVLQNCGDVQRDLKNGKERKPGESTAFAQPMSGSYNVEKFHKEKETIGLCTYCGQRVGEPYFICLDSACMAIVCHEHEKVHAKGHPMLRLPKQLDGRRRAAEAARIILCSMNSGKQRKLCDKKERKKHEKEEKALKKAAKTESFCNKLHCKRAAEFVLMENVFDNAGSVVVTWLIVNTGKKQWDDEVKLLWLASAGSVLSPEKWEVSVPPLKPGEDAQVSVKLQAPTVPGEYKAFWMLNRRGKRFGDLTANIIVPAITEDVKEQGQPMSNVASEHSYALTQSEPQQEASPSSETFERIDVHETEVVDEECSLISGITTCKSAAVEQDYDLVSGNDDGADFQASEATEERDDSYVSIDSPVIDESLSTTGELSEQWQRLTISLSSLGQPRNGDLETADDIGVESEGKETDVELIEFEEDKRAPVPETEKTQEAAVTPVPEAENKQETPVASFQPEEACEDEEELTLVTVKVTGTVTIKTDDSQPEGDLVSEQAGGVSEHVGHDEHLRGSTETLKSFSSSRSSSFDNKRQQIGETVSHALSHALLTTTQTLATVGATAKEIGTIAKVIVRTNFQENGGPRNSWQPPRAWVPKATQTVWTPSENQDVEGGENADAGYNPYTRQMTQLVEMGFCDLEKNERLMRENHGNLDRVILILLDQYCLG